MDLTPQPDEIQIPYWGCLLQPFRNFRRSFAETLKISLWRAGSFIFQKETFMFVVPEFYYLGVEIQYNIFEPHSLNNKTKR
jgi:hypothetical protein